MNDHDEALVVQAAREEIQGRLAYWKMHVDHPAALFVVANLQWALAQLDPVLGRIHALRDRESTEMSLVGLVESITPRDDQGSIKDYGEQ